MSGRQSLHQSLPIVERLLDAADAMAAEAAHPGAIKNLLREAAGVIVSIETKLASLMDASFIAYSATGSDTDGDNEWHCTVDQAGNSLVRAVRQLRRDYDEALAE